MHNRVTHTLETTGCETFAEECRQRREAAKEAAFARLEKTLTLIKPCPFCGGVGDYSRDGRTHAVGCQNSDCPVKPSIESDVTGWTAAQLVAAWNRRI